jgi:hypothetical protein
MELLKPAQLLDYLLILQRELVRTQTCPLFWLLLVLRQFRFFPAGNLLCRAADPNLSAL